MRGLLLLAAAAVITAGCASAGATGPGAPDGAAAIVPSNVVAFVAARTDLDSAAWHSIAKAYAKQYESLEPALGDELDVAILSGEQPVGFTQPKDPAKLGALAKKHGLVTRTIGEWTAVAKTQAALDVVSGAKQHLADVSLFTQAMSRLPADALVRAYASGDQVERLVAAIPGQLETSLAPVGTRYRLGHRYERPKTAATVGGTGFRWGAAAVTSSSKGFAIQGFARPGVLTSSGPPRYVIHTISPYRSVLVDEIPAGALAVADFQVPGGTFENMPALPESLRKLFDPSAVSGVPLQLDTILGGETAIYVRPALPTPEVTIVTQPSDTAAASATLDDLLRTTTAKAPTLYRAVIGGQFVVSTTQKGIDDFRAGGQKLSADPAFVDAAKQAKLPEQTTGFVYANLGAALPLLRLAGLTVPAGLPDFTSFLAYGARAGGDSTFSAFIGVG
jgi:hypothetical protein